MLTAIDRPVSLEVEAVLRWRRPWASLCAADGPAVHPSFRAGARRMARRSASLVAHPLTQIHPSRRAIAGTSGAIASSARKSIPAATHSTASSACASSAARSTSVPSRRACSQPAIAGRADLERTLAGARLDLAVGHAVEQRLDRRNERVAGAVGGQRPSWRRARARPTLEATVAQSMPMTLQ